MIKPIDQMGMGPMRKAEREGNEWVVTVIPPAWSGYVGSSINLTNEQYDRYLAWLDSGQLIQDVFPELRSWEREILVSGIPPKDFPREEE